MFRLKKIVIGLSLLWPSLLLADMMNVTLYYVGSQQGQTWAGLEQGLSEANLQGQFLGQNYVIKQVSVEELSAVPSDSMTAVFVASNDENILQIAESSAYQNIPVFNLTSDDTSLRAACLPNLLNIPPSQKMKQDAEAQWQAKNPDIQVTAQAWHHDFKKFAASQLNKRFSKNHEMPMEDDAWAAWAAVKMISDTVARTQQTDGASLLAHLKNDLSFDSQKGINSTFRETGQLRQILLLTDDQNKIVAEAPLRGVKGGVDSLGLTECP